MNEYTAISYNDINAEKDPFYYYKRVLLYSLVISALITVPFVLVELMKAYFFVLRGLQCSADCILQALRGDGQKRRYFLGLEH